MISESSSVTYVASLLPVQSSCLSSITSHPENTTFYFRLELIKERRQDRNVTNCLLWADGVMLPPSYCHWEMWPTWSVLCSIDRNRKTTGQHHSQVRQRRKLVTGKVSIILLSICRGKPFEWVSISSYQRTDRWSFSPVSGGSAGQARVCRADAGPDKSQTGYEISQQRREVSPPGSQPTIYIHICNM